MTGVVCSVGRGLWWFEREVLRSLVMERLTEPKVGKGPLEGFWDTDWDGGGVFVWAEGEEGAEGAEGWDCAVGGGGGDGGCGGGEGAGEEVEDIEEVEGRRGEGIRDTDGKFLPLGGWERCGVEIMLVGLGVESQSRLECSICVCKRF